jgi:hypothetical protein
MTSILRLIHIPRHLEDNPVEVGLWLLIRPQLIRQAVGGGLERLSSSSKHQDGPSSDAS